MTPVCNVVDRKQSRFRTKKAKLIDTCARRATTVFAVSALIAVAVLTAAFLCPVEVIRQVSGWIGIVAGVVCYSAFTVALVGSLLLADDERSDAQQ